MKIIILHGDYVSASYARLLRFIEVAKSRGWQTTFLDNPESISEKLSSVSLFGQSPFFIIRGINQWPLSTLKKTKKVLEKGEGTAIFYHDDFLGKGVLDFLPKGAKLEQFKLPRLIFDFLDSFYPGNSRRTLKILHELVVKEPAEFIFALLAKHLRDLFWVKTDSPLPYPPWRVSKLKAQASKFKEEDLKGLINQLSEIDLKVKKSEAELIPSLDLLALTLLK